MGGKGKKVRERFPRGPNVDDFLEVRGTPEFKEWFNQLKEKPSEDRYDVLRELGQYFLISSFEPWNNPSLITEVNDGIRKDGTQPFYDMNGGWWTTRFPNKYPGEVGLYNVLHPDAVLLALKLMHLSGTDMVVYGCSGSDAVDIALRIAWQFQRTKPSTSTLPRQKVISIRGAYHGSTGLALSVSGDPDKPFIDYCRDFPLRSTDFVQRLPFPGKNPEWHTEIDKIPVDEAAAFIFEPIMGVGGNRDIRKGIDYGVKHLEGHSAITIADEISTGFYVTGTPFASDTLSRRPDIITVGKFITNGEVPLSAVLLNERVAKVVRENFDHFPYGHTLAGHPLACERAIEVLDTLEYINAGEIAREKGSYIEKRLHESLDHLPAVIDIRVYGLMGGIQVQNSQFASDIAERLRTCGGYVSHDPYGDYLREARGQESPTHSHLVRHHKSTYQGAIAGYRVGTEGNTITLRPPFTVHNDEIDHFTEKFSEAIIAVYVESKQR